MRQLLLALTSLGVADALRAETQEMGSTASTASAMMQVTLGLVAVIALMLVLAWVAKRMRLVPGYNPHRALKVIAVLPLSNRERLTLVQVGDQQLLLGVTANQINCLHELEKPIDLAGSSSGKAGFSQLLQQWKQKNSASTSDASHEKDSKHEG
ncbi:flagellar biosynthetic protein FliO [Marinospirillum perlucidum]|uniref:flagellar biosynthetic protein FliO n=1 Tax=Marinospirillum perlucidum TaxID=1982602 RepID=UPI000DF4BCEB|nr:flagellar biosynthetic protein FliO [Marinospirillum perlucidum]